MFWVYTTQWWRLSEHSQIPRSQSEQLSASTPVLRERLFLATRHTRYPRWLGIGTWNLSKQVSVPIPVLVIVTSKLT
jgi:hypothetical protein